MARMLKLFSVMVFCALGLANGGCMSLKYEPTGPVPREVRPYVIRLKSQDFLRQFAARKDSLHPDKTPRLVLCDELDVRGLPQNAPSAEAMIEKAFADLAPAKLVFLPRDKQQRFLTDQGFPTKLFQEFYRVNILGQDPLPTATGSGNDNKSNSPAGEIPEPSNAERAKTQAVDVVYTTLRGQIFLDQVVQNQDKGVNLRALIGVENNQRFIEPDLDLSFGSERSTLRVSLWATDPFGFVTRSKAELQVDLVKDVKSGRFAILFYGSGGNGFQKVSVADGLGAALQTVVSHALVVLLGRQIGVDYWRCGVGGEVDENVFETVAEYSEAYRVLMAGELLKNLGYLADGEKIAEERNGRIITDQKWNDAAERFWKERGLSPDGPTRPGFLNDLLAELMAANKPSVNSLPKEQVVMIRPDGLAKEETEQVIQAVWSRPGVRAVRQSENDPNVYEVTLRTDVAFLGDALRRAIPLRVEQTADASGQICLRVFRSTDDDLLSTPVPAEQLSSAALSKRPDFAESSSSFVSASGISESREVSGETERHRVSIAKNPMLIMRPDIVDFSCDLKLGQSILLSNQMTLRLMDTKTDGTAQFQLDGSMQNLRQGQELALAGRSPQERLILAVKFAGRNGCVLRAYLTKT